MSTIIKGTEFDYRIDTEYGINHDGFIAEGTESIVFKGIKYGSDLRYSCALKFKPLSRLRDFREREYNILESMQTCRSVVRVLDVIENLGEFSIPYANGEISAKNCFCVVEEYIDGDSLQDYCIKQWFQYNNQERKWTRNSTQYTYREIVKFQNQIVQFMINLCEIMKFVSNINVKNGKSDENKPIVLHCDIKPENIMVTKHGKELVLIDFGRSRALTNSRTYQHYSDKLNETFIANYSEGQWQDVGKDNFYAYGTVGYAAPECYAEQSKEVSNSTKGSFPFVRQRSTLKHGLVSVESDIFGFGATFWECFSIYEMGMKILEENPDTSNPNFLNKAIIAKYEEEVHKGDVDEYCDRDFHNINIAYHEKLEEILKKCTHVRTSGFQDPTNENYYHNFHQLQTAVEEARDTIPSLDRKSDPHVGQMVNIAGFCSALTGCFFVMFLILKIFSNSIAWDKWNSLKSGYTDNQWSSLKNITEEMLSVPFEKQRYDNFDEILSFMHGGETNDQYIDIKETEILTDLLRNHLPNQSMWGEYLNIIVKNAKKENLDDISENVYALNLSDNYQSDGYELAKAIYQTEHSRSGDEDILLDAYDILLKYQNNSDYKNAVSRLAGKLKVRKRVDTISSNRQITREELNKQLNRLSGEE